MIGEVIDHYRVLELIGRGAMGVVYKALDVNLDRLVAIKVMGAEVRSTPDFVERFRQEARLQAAAQPSPCRAALRLLYPRGRAGRRDGAH